MSDPALEFFCLRLVRADGERVQPRLGNDDSLLFPASGVNFTDPPLVGVEAANGHPVVRVFEHRADIFGDELIGPFEEGIHPLCPLLPVLLSRPLLPSKHSAAKRMRASLRAVASLRAAWEMIGTR